jgi:hypothetical protein
VQIDNNLIYSNNFALYASDDPPVEPLVGLVPTGTGILWAGHNDGKVFNNWIFDNWRQGAQLIAIPDAFVEPEGEVNDGISCPTVNVPPFGTFSTSCGNRYFGNKMGVAPPGFRMPTMARAFGNAVGGNGGVLPNGVDFWWDERETNTGNCWFLNTGPDGTEASITPGRGAPPDPLPSNCTTSVGNGDPVKTQELLDCFAAREEGVGVVCTWADLPPRPRTAGARAYNRQRAREARRFLRSGEADRLQQRTDERSAGGGG